MYDVHIEVESLVYIYVYVGSRTIFFPVVLIFKNKSNASYFTSIRYDIEIGLINSILLGN